MGMAEQIINTTGTEVPPAQQPEELDANQMRAIIKREARRLAVLAQNKELTAAQVLAEISGTVLPLLGDVNEISDRLENHAEWASGEIDRIAGDTAESQLLPEDAQKLDGFVDGCIEFFQQSYDHLDANQKTQAKELLQMAEEGRQMKKLIADLVIDGPDDDDDDEPDGDEPDGDEPDDDEPEAK